MDIMRLLAMTYEKQNPSSDSRIIRTSCCQSVVKLLNERVDLLKPESKQTPTTNRKVSYPFDLDYIPSFPALKTPEIFKTQ